MTIPNFASGLVSDTEGLIGTFLGGMITLGSNQLVLAALQTAVIGTLVVVLKKALTAITTWIDHNLFPSTFIHYNDTSFPWLEAYLARNPEIQANIHSCRLSAADAKENARSAIAPRRGVFYWPGRDPRPNKNEGAASFSFGSLMGQRTPVNDTYVRIIFKGHWVWIKRSYTGFARSEQKDTDNIELRTLVWNNDLIREFMMDVHASFFKKSEGQLSIFHPKARDGGQWSDPISRANRIWESVFLPGTAKSELLEDIKGFLSDEEKEWYAATGIPHRRGYLLHGPPGAGKTTLVTALASQLKLDIFVIDPAAKGLDDAMLNKVFRLVPPGNMILIEDIDCVMPPRKNKNGDEDDEDAPAVTKGTKDENKSLVTLSGLLNAIDGVSSQENCILFATTNYLDRLDDALQRPGRFDVHVGFENATAGQAEGLFSHFYTPKTPVKSRQVTDRTDDATTDTTKLCPSEKSGLQGTLEEVTVPGQNMISLLSGRASRAEIIKLGKSFSKVIFEHPYVLSDGSNMEFSMAALQGYLLKNKKDPWKAARDVGEWVEELRLKEEDKLKTKAELKAEKERKKQEEKEKEEKEAREKEDKEKAGEAVAGATVDEAPLTPVSPV